MEEVTCSFHKVQCHYCDFLVTEGHAQEGFNLDWLIIAED